MGAPRRKGVGRPSAAQTGRLRRLTGPSRPTVTPASTLVRRPPSKPVTGLRLARGDSPTLLVGRDMAATDLRPTSRANGRPVETDVVLRVARKEKLAFRPRLGRPSPPDAETPRT